MTSVHLNVDLESFIRDAVQSGRYSDEAEVISDALVRLRNAIDSNPETPDDSSAISGPGKKLTKQGFHRHLVKIGLLVPPSSTDSALTILSA